MLVINGLEERGSSSGEVLRPGILATQDHPEGWFVINLAEIEYIEGDGSEVAILIHYKSGNVLKIVCKKKKERDLLLELILRTSR